MDEHPDHEHRDRNPIEPGHRQTSRIAEHEVPAWPDQERHQKHGTESQGQDVGTEGAPGGREPRVVRDARGHRDQVKITAYATTTPMATGTDGLIRGRLPSTVAVWMGSPVLPAGREVS